MDKLLFRLTIAFLLVISICLVANADTYVIYYPEHEQIKSQVGFPYNNELHLIIKTKHIISQNNYCYMKVLYNVDTQKDKFILLPDKNIDTINVIKY